LNEIETASTKQEEEIRALQNECEGLKQQIHEQQQQAEMNEKLNTKIQNRIQFLNGKIESNAKEREKLQRQEKTQDVQQCGSWKLPLLQNALSAVNSSSLTGYAQTAAHTMAEK